MKRAPAWTITLGYPGDVYNFHVGQPITIGTRQSWLFYLPVVGWLLRRFRPRTICQMIDYEQGVVGFAEQRWSWRRWRWEAR